MTAFFIFVQQKKQKKCFSTLSKNKLFCYQVTILVATSTMQYKSIFLDFWQDLENLIIHK